MLALPQSSKYSLLLAHFPNVSMIQMLPSSSLLTLFSSSSFSSPHQDRGTKPSAAVAADCSAGVQPLSLTLLIHSLQPSEYFLNALSSVSPRVLCFVPTASSISQAVEGGGARAAPSIASRFESTANLNSSFFQVFELRSFRRKKSVSVFQMGS